jgi:hypothetical protein
MNALRLSPLFVSLALVACGPQEELGSDDTLGTSSSALGFSAAEAAAVVDLVNYPGTDLTTLDAKVGLERRAAQNLIASRDVRAFASLAEIDAVPYVGNAALLALVKYAKTAPAPAGEVIEGVSFKGWEAEAVVWAVNSQSYAALDSVLDARAVTNLVAARPFAHLAQVGAVSLVGPTALGQLHGKAAAWWAMMRGATVTLAGTFDGVSFDEATAVKALELANTSTRDQLISGGVPANPVSAMLGNRPFTSLAGVANVGGVGTSAMQGLKAFAQASMVDAIQALKNQLAPLTADIWFPSETDARMLFVSSPNIGTAPINEALIRARLSEQHDALLPQVMYVEPSWLPLAGRTYVEELNANDYFNHIINAADPNDPDSLALAQRIAAVRDALMSQLTDVKVFRFNKISISVFIVGRTHTGDLAGLLTGQVET